MPGFSLKTVSVDNAGSDARDFCAIERTYLSHIRLGLLLSLLSAAILLNARLPDPRIAESSTPTYTVPLGTLFFVASILGLAAGVLNYDRLWRGLRNHAAFVQSSRIHTVIMGSIALLIISTIVTLLSRGQ